jgi:hypothetical protein
MTGFAARSFAAPALMGVVAATCVAVAIGRSAFAAETSEAGAKPSIDLAEKGAFPLPAHLEAADIAAGKYSFEQLFEFGDDLFHAAFNGMDGVGVASLANGARINRFALTPPGGTVTAISSQSCGGCHRSPFAASAGEAVTHISFDFDQDGKGPFNTRSTTSVFGDGVLQLLAIEISEDLMKARDAAAADAKKSPGRPVERRLESKGVAYGAIIATADASGNVKYDTSKLEGVDSDLVVRPMGWKGGVPTVRLNTMAPALGAMGMQPEEFVLRVPGGDEKRDLDGDGVVRELSVGDITAMTLYTAAQETPQSFARLAELGYVVAPTREQTAQIERGRAAFESAGCATCHRPEMHLRNTVFEEPTARAGGAYHDKVLAAKNPGYSPERPVKFDLLTQAQEPRLEKDARGGAIVRLYGDLKRHRMGRHLADQGGPTPSFVAEFAPLAIDGQVVLIAPEAFLTPELWGVGNTPPYLHDGRAGTLREAVLLHGEDTPAPAGDPGRSEAQEARDAFAKLPAAQQTDLIAFLRSLQTFSPGEPF